MGDGVVIKMQMHIIPLASRSVKCFKTFGVHY